LFITALSAQTGTRDKAQSDIATHRELLKQITDQVYLRDSSLKFLWDKSNNNWYELPSTRQKYSYNDQGLLIHYIYEMQIDSAPDCSPMYKYDVTYNNDGQMIEWADFDWDINSQAWIPYEHDYFTYNSSGILIDETYKYPNTLNNTWFIGYNWKYNDSGACTEETFYDWDHESFAIIYGTHTIYTLNEDNNPIETLELKLDLPSQLFVNNLKTISEYIDEFLVKETLYKYIWSASDWQLNHQHFYSYYPNGMLSDEFWETWDPLSSTWMNSSKTNYEYNIDGYMTQKLNKQWSYPEWKNAIRTLNTYDADNRLTEYLMQFWMDTCWATGFQRLITYNSNGGRDTYTSLAFDPNNGLTISGYYDEFEYSANGYNSARYNKGWNTDSNQFENDFKELYYYSMYEAGTKEPSTDCLPCRMSNPYINGTSITCSLPMNNGSYEMTIYSMSGIQVFRQTISDNMSFIPENLPKGLYLLVIRQGEKVSYRSKVVVI